MTSKYSFPAGEPLGDILSLEEKGSETGSEGGPGGVRHTKGQFYPQLCVQRSIHLDFLPLPRKICSNPDLRMYVLQK